MLFPDFLEQIIVERALGREAADRITRGRLPRHLIEPVARLVGEMSRLFTRQRDQLPGKYLRKTFKAGGGSRQSSDRSSASLCDVSPARAGYLLYFFPINFPKIQALLRELALYPDGLPNKPNLRVLDIGCGPGTALLGAIDYFRRVCLEHNAADVPPRRSSLQPVALDRLGENLADCRWLFSRYGDYMRADAGSSCISLAEVDLETVALDVERASQARISKLLGSGGRYDLIIISNTLNELFYRSNDPIERRAALLARVSDELLAEDGSLVLIEPALRATSRDLLAVRDELVSRHGLSIYSPCTHGGACPLLAEGRERDWCHSVYPYQRPHIVAQIDRLIGARNDSLKFSYVILRKDDKKLSDVLSAPSTALWRAVGDMLRVKGQSYVWMCGVGGFRKHVLLDRDLSDNNSGFKKIERGSIASIDNVSEEGSVRQLNKSSVVRIHN